MNEDYDISAIAFSARRYAMERGASRQEADEVAAHVVKRLRKATEHAVTRAGFAPWRLK